jgi:hypothetical protein
MMPKRRFIVRPAYLLLAGMVLGLAAAFLFRAEISRAVPALDIVYSLMGISTSSPAEDLETANLVFNRRNGQVGLFRSRPTCSTSRARPLPDLAVIALDADRNRLEPAHVFRLSGNDRTRRNDHLPHLHGHPAQEPRRPNEFRVE